MTAKIRVLIVDDLSETRENVRKLLQFEPDIEVIGQAGNGHEAIAMAQQHHPDVILMDINMPELDGINSSKAIAQSVPSAQIVIMSVQSEADYIRRAMLAGARDFLMKPFTGDELVTAVRRAYEMRPRGMSQASGPRTRPAEPAVNGRAERRYEGRLVTVFSPKGGSGCTTIAMNLAVSLAQAGRRTVLVDGSVQFGNVGVMLNIKPATSIVDVIERIDDLDQDLISSVVLGHKSGVRVLLAPPRPEMAELVTPVHMEKLLRALRHFHDFVVVDTSSALNDLTLAMFDASDLILLVAEQSLPSLNNVSRFFDLIGDLNYQEEKMLLVINRSSSQWQISVKDVANILKRPVLMAIPADDLVVNQAANQGYPLVDGPHEKRPVADALSKLADRVMERLQRPDESESQQAKPASRLARLFNYR